MPNRTPSGWDKIAVGRRIREAATAKRAASGQTFKQLASLAGVEPHTFDRYMSGKTGQWNKLPELAQVLGRSVEWLRGDDGAPVQDATQRVVEDFIRNEGPKLRPKLTTKEATFLRVWPHHRVDAEKLRQMIRDARDGISPAEMAEADRVTEEMRRIGAQLGVPKAQP